MGIDKLGQFLKTRAPNAFLTYTLDQLRNYRLAIDADGYFKRHLSKITSEYIKDMVDPSEPIDREIIVRAMLDRLFSLYKKMAYYGITLIFVWDGKVFPAKISCIQERNKIKEDNELKIVQELEKFNAIDPLLRQTSDIKNLKAALLTRCSRMSREERQFFIEIIKKVGMPCLTADYDGEKL